MSQPQCLPIISWMINCLRLVVFSLTIFWKNLAPCSAAVHAPSVCLTGITSLSTVFGRPTTVNDLPESSRCLANAAAMVLVSSPPMVCKILIPSFSNCFAAISRGFSPSFTKPFSTQSSILVNFTLLLPIGLPPKSYKA